MFVFDYITLSKDLIGSFINYIHLVIHKDTNEIIINLVAKEFAIYINTAKKLIT